MKYSGAGVLEKKNQSNPKESLHVTSTFQTESRFRLAKKKKLLNNEAGETLKWVYREFVDASSLKVLIISLARIEQFDLCCLPLWKLYLLMAGGLV